MKISRNVTNSISFILDNLLPPLIRDSKWFMLLPMKLFYGKDYSTFMNFKRRLPFYSEKDIHQIYEDSEHGKITRETDLNSGSISFILSHLSGKKVLDIGCGTGYLCDLIAKDGYDVVGADFVITNEAKQNYPDLKLVETTIEKTGFSDQEFDTVISAHTIEHIAEPVTAIKELRRIARKKLIIILPCQRPYQYTFDLHVNFYPYEYNVLREIKPTSENFSLKKIQGDWVYEEWFE